MEFMTVYNDWDHFFFCQTSTMAIVLRAMFKVLRFSPSLIKIAKVIL
jgi:hypothetical protein